MAIYCNRHLAEALKRRETTFSFFMLRAEYRRGAKQVRNAGTRATLVPNLAPQNEIEGTKKVDDRLGDFAG
jgi:hypothetical protein